VRKLLKFLLIIHFVPVYAFASSIGSLEIKAENSTFAVNWHCTINTPAGLAIVLQSTKQGSSAVTTQSTSAVEVDAESCDDLSFEKEDIDGDGILDIAVNTINVGLQKTRAIFLFDLAHERFVFAGRLPIAADMMAPNKYKLVESQGGSVFETLFEIHDKKIRAFSQKELVLDGTVCVSESKHIIRANGKCPSLVITATKRKPICIDHRQKTPRFVAQVKCKELLFY
jgi:hypothetical protein